MAATTLQSFPNSDVKLRFNEPYVSDGLNAKFAGIIPRGIYRGYSLVAGAAPLTAQLDPDADNRHLAVYETLLNRSLTLTRSGGPISVPLAAFAGTTVYVVIFAEYTTSSPTIAELRVYSVADYESAPEKDELIVLGVVDVPGAGVIPDANVSIAQATYPWKESSLAFRPWKQVVYNGSFDEGRGQVAAPSQSIPGFNGEESGTAVIQVNDAFGRGGSPGLLMQITGMAAVGRLGPGQFDIAKPLSGGVVPVQPGQLVDVSLYLAGSAVTGYSAGTSGLRCILNFYNLAGVLQSTVQIESDPTVHIGTFDFTQLSEVFAAPSVGYFTWYLEASVDLVAGASQFFVDDLRIFVQPRATQQEDGDIPTSAPASRALRLDIVPDNAPDRFTENLSTARLSATIDGDSATVIALSKAGLSTPTSEMPRLSTPFIFKGIDQDYSALGFGVVGTESTADQDSVPHEYKLIHTSRNRQADATCIRTYVRTTPSETVITSNARWGGGGAQLWHPDDVTYDAFKLTIGNAGIRWESRDGMLPASWADSAWTGTVGAGKGLVELLFDASLKSQVTDATVPLLTTNKVPQDDVNANNRWKLIIELPTGAATGIYARIYVGNTGFPFIHGNFAITLNAEWDPVALKWQADDTAISALRWGMLSDPILGSRQTWASKAVTTVPWSDAVGGFWDFSPTAGIGDSYFPGELKWSAARTRTVLLPPPMAMPGGSTTLDWSILASGLRRWSNNTNGGKLTYELPVPDGALLSRVRVLGEALVGNPWTILLAKDGGGYDFTTPPGTPTTTSLDSDTSPGAPGYFVVTLTCLDTVDKENYQYYLLVTAGANASDQLFAVEMRYSESQVYTF